jgi:hypothetical protein
MRMVFMMRWTLRDGMKKFQQAHAKKEMISMSNNMFLCCSKWKLIILKNVVYTNGYTRKFNGKELEKDFIFFELIIETQVLNITVSTFYICVLRAF